MHPEMLRQIIEQRGRETQARAERNRLAMQLIRTLRAQRRNGTATASDNYAIPAIPDYVDGTFVDSATGEAKTAAGRVPAARDAA
jgi:hypothetical protein